MRVLSVGEVLWDVFPDSEFLGGAPLNLCANLIRCGDQAVLLSAVGDDERGRATLNAMNALGLETDFVQVVSDKPTGIAEVASDARGEPSFTIHRPAAFDEIHFSDDILREVRSFDPAWLYMGTLLQTETSIEKTIREFIELNPDIRCFYDMNLRNGHWNLALVERLCHSASILKLNDNEAKLLSSLVWAQEPHLSLEHFCSAWAERFDIDVICVTLGSAGCLIHWDGRSERFRGYAIQVSDTIGAGDAFAAAFLHGYQAGWQMAECAHFANALGAIVASRPGATPLWSKEECYALINSNSETS